MAYIWSLATALPPHELTAEGTRRIGRAVFARAMNDDFSQYDQLVAHTGIERRHTVRPADELLIERSIAETCEIYRETACSLAKEALEKALESAGVRAEQIDALVLTSSTGFTIPSIDAYLINDLGMRPSTRRLPYTSLGCAGGAGGLIRASEAVAARGAESRVALVCVETPSITFRPEDQTMANVISSTLFGDGAAAVILGGKAPAASKARAFPTLRVRASRTWLHPETYDTMGFRAAPDGFRIVLAPDVPEVAANRLPELIRELAADGRATSSDLGFFAIHPGGARVLDKVTKVLGLSDTDVASAWHVLRQHGNMSSPTVLFVLEEQLRRQRPLPGALGVVAAFGPGFVTELVLVEAVGVAS